MRRALSNQSCERCTCIEETKNVEAYEVSAVDDNVKISNKKSERESREEETHVGDAEMRHGRAVKLW